MVALKRYGCIIESEYGSNQLALKIPTLQMNRSYLTTVRRLTLAKQEKTKTGLKEPAPLNQPVSNPPVAQNPSDQSQQGWGDSLRSTNLGELLAQLNGTHGVRPSQISQGGPVRPVR